MLSASLPIARLCVGGIFLLAAVPKVLSPGEFADAVRAFHMLPGALVLPFALIVPWLELLTAAYLLLGYLARVGAGLAIVLLLSFVAALGRALITGDTHHACGCFGSGAHANVVLAFLAGGDTITPWDLIRDVLLIGLSGLVLIGGAGPFSLEGFLQRDRGYTTGGGRKLPRRSAT